jgi:hypothetical protein
MPRNKSHPALLKKLTKLELEKRLETQLRDVDRILANLLEAHNQIDVSISNARLVRASITHLQVQQRFWFK